MLRCRAVVELQQAAEAASARHRPGSRGVGIGCRIGWEQDHIALPLVRPLGVIMFNVIVDRSFQRALAKEDQLVEAFFLDGSHESLGVGVEVGTSWRQPEAFDPRRFEDCSERLAMFGIPVENHVLHTVGEAGVGHRDVACNLIHPLLSRVCRHARDVDLPASDVNEEQDVVGDGSKQRPDFLGEKIAPEQNVFVRRDEVGPGRSLFPLGGRRLAVFLEDVTHRRVGDFVTQFFKRADDSVISPSRVLLREAKDQFNDRRIGWRPSQIAGCRLAGGDFSSRQASDATAEWCPA